MDYSVSAFFVAAHTMCSQLWRINLKSYGKVKKLVVLPCYKFTIPAAAGEQTLADVIAEQNLSTIHAGRN